MKLFFTILLLIILSINCLAQKNADTIKYGTVQKIPVREGYVFSLYSRFGDHGPNLAFRSKCDSVFCKVNCTVRSIFCLDGDDSFLLVKDDYDMFYTFFVFKQLSCVKGQKIKRGDFLGLLKKEEGDDEFQLHFTITNNKGREIDEDKMWKMIENASTE